MKMFNRKRYITRNYHLLIVLRELGGGNALKSQPENEVKWHFLRQAEPEARVLHNPSEWWAGKSIKQQKMNRDKAGQGKARTKDTALHPQRDISSWTGEQGQLLLPPLLSVLITRDPRVVGSQKRPESLSGDFCEKCEAMPPRRCCVKGVQRYIYKYVIYICLFLWAFLARDLLPQLLHKPDEK